MAFREEDSDRFFGREVQIDKLWQKFCDLHQDESTVRILPIYGPSGSGKSSLARAGLIPALGKRTLPGRDRSRLGVLVPGTHPLEALATVLARIATNDTTPVEKAQEFERVLKTQSDKGKYEGLRRIADGLPDIAFSPLMILVDQFEEVYTYALLPDKTERDRFIAERDAFIENLLCAAAEPTKRVSIILTLRSDFLGDTQQHPRLNKLFSTQGFLVPVMQPEELKIAITKPAEQAKHKLDIAIVQLLIEQTQGREGALPLLQFALTRIWEGLQNEIEPTETLQRIGGVGGALAGEAERVYKSLKPEDQAIARSIFLALVQLNENSGDTRRRAAVSELIATDGDEDRVWSVINLFAAPRVRFLAIFLDKQQGEMIEMIEVAHEALIRNWKQLQDWLKECREALRKKRKIEQAAEEWKYQKKSKDYLLQGRVLRDAREFLQAQKENTETSLSGLATEFVKASVKKQQIDFKKKILTIFVAPSLLLTPLIFHFGTLLIANQVLYKKDCHPDANIGFFLQYLVKYGGKKELSGLQLCREYLGDVKLSGIIMPNTNFEKSNLSKSHFDKAILADSNFRGSFLAYTDFSNALLMGADFRCSEQNSECSDLLNANFENANLTESKFQQAILENANFRGANLTKANFSDAQKITENQLKKSIICQTLLPKHIKIPKDRNCPIR